MGLETFAHEKFHSSFGQAADIGISNFQECQDVVKKRQKLSLYMH